MIKNSNLFWEKIPDYFYNHWQALLFDPKNRNKLLCSFSILKKEKFPYTISIIPWIENDLCNALSKIFKNNAEFSSLEEAKDYVEECIEKTFKLIIFL